MDKCKTCGEYGGKHSEDACEPSRQEYGKREVCDNCRRETIEVQASKKIPDFWVCASCINKD